MPRNLIVFSDGTGNSAAKLFKTNVWRVYDALDLTCPDQIAYYDDGVGTASLAPLALLGGAFGWGLKRNVLDLYCFLCRNYRDTDDRIFAFGFSRGAFTVRVLTGLIASEGLIHADSGTELKRLAAWAYRRYRQRNYNQTGGLVRPLRWARDIVFSFWDRLRGRTPYDPSQSRQVSIEFLGVWDTVDAYGLPFDEMTRGWDRWIWPLSLPNQRLWKNVNKACHALSIDDERQTFHPLLWDESKEGVETSARVSDERVSQVWFAGVHSNIGGGYPDDSLSYTPLCWIAGEAHKRGLRFMRHLCSADIPDAWKEKAASCAPMHDSRRGPGAYYRYAPRRIEGLQKDIEGRALVIRPKIHHTVLERIKAGVDGYAPIVLPERYAVVDRAGGILSGDIDDHPPAAAPNPFEHSTQAATRSIEQEDAWNAVWRRRVAYFATVGFTLLLLAIPLWPGRDRIGYFDYALPTFSAGVSLIGGMLPGFLEPWLVHYETYPLQLVLGATVLAALLIWGTKLQQSINDRMTAAWTHGGLSAARVEVPQPPVSRFMQLRTSPAYFAFFRFFSRNLWPHVFGIAMLFLIIGAIPISAIRASFDTATAVGWMCRDQTPATLAGPGPWLLTFEPSRFCHSTGIPIEREARYRVEIVLPEGAGHWRDDDIDVLSPAGFSSSYKPWLFYPAAPLRRVVKADWFVPIARVGATGAEHYALNTPVATFTAQRNGRLILFVNDVVAPLPKWDYFYRNNTGDAACVRVTKLKPNESDAAIADDPPRCVDRNSPAAAK